MCNSNNSWKYHNERFCDNSKIYAQRDKINAEDGGIDIQAVDLCYDSDMLDSHFSEN